MCDHVLRAGFKAIYSPCERECQKHFLGARVPQCPQGRTPPPLEADGAANQFTKYSELFLAFFPNGSGMPPLEPGGGSHVAAKGTAVGPERASPGKNHGGKAIGFTPLC